MSLQVFHPPTQRWFDETFGQPTRVQTLGWPAIAGGEHVLMLAPTGSGKTLAAFLYAIDRVLFEAPPAKDERCRILYISPLKALAVDVERNLNAPLAGTILSSQALATPFHTPTISVRTGDTPSDQRQAFLRRPTDILITTPESLFLMLTSHARERLRSVRWVIVDEIHTMVGTKRGAHLALSLERLREITHVDFQRIGLSATVQPLDEAARFLGGGTIGPANRWTPRPVRIVDAGTRRALDIRIEVPAEDMTAFVPGDSEGASPKSIWPSIHPRILELIRAHQTTLIFVNARRLAERLAAAINELAGEELVRAHHGSVSREQRQQIEADLKAGRLQAIAATSSLELGIDMGSIDLVIQVETPIGVSSGLQRVGRAGHQVGSTSKGIFFPKFRGDLLASAAILPEMVEGHVEAQRYPRNPLDLLAQHIVAIIGTEPQTVDQLHALVRRAAPFADLSSGLLADTLDMLAGRYPSDDFSGLRPRIVWDRTRGTVRAREGAKSIAIANAGTIPDRGLFGAFLSGAEGPQARVGELDEEMVFETRVGETFVLGATTWRVDEITTQRVLVSPAPGEPGKLPFWKGDGFGRPFELGQAIGRLTRELQHLAPSDAVHQLETRHHLETRAARHLVDYVADQGRATGAVPDDRTIVVERYSDEIGDWRLCILSPFGGRIHAPWAQAIRRRIRESREYEAELLWTDDGIVIRFSEMDDPPDTSWFFPNPDEIEELVVQELGGSALFAARFREAASRALLLPRRFSRQRSPLWQQRKRAADLLSVASRFREFPIILEVYRELLKDVFDMPALIEVMKAVRGREIRVVTVDTRTPSPFASSLLFGYVGNFMYSGDAPLAERRAQALTIDPVRLRELMGETELREVLDPEVIAAIELKLQGLDAPDRVRNADDIHDLLRRLGDLSEDEIQARSTLGNRLLRTLRELQTEKQAIPVTIAGERRWIAAEDAARYRDATGIRLPKGLPAAFTRRTPDAAVDLIGRYARTHGPFTISEVQHRFGLGTDVVESTLTHLVSRSRIIEGEFRASGAGLEWCDHEVLQKIRRNTLARIRHQVEPVEPAAYGRFLPEWHRLGMPARGPEALLEAIGQIQGYPMPASVLESHILRARVQDYDPQDLDLLMTSGLVVWSGVEPLGSSDGRIVLYRSENAAALLKPSEVPKPEGPLHTRVRETLSTSGASFFPQIERAVGAGFKRELLHALWDLVWSGEVTNDTLAPLRALLQSSHIRARRSGVPRGGYAASLPPEAAGRWSLVSQTAGPEPSATDRLTALARQLLYRAGILTRESIASEHIAGGFSALYPMLKALEEAGRCRRGYFVAGRGAAQFADAAATDRLRDFRDRPRESRTVVIASTDPANPYGAMLPWPDRSDQKLVGRFAGTQVVLVDGELAAYISKSERSLLTFFDAAGPDAARFARAIVGILVTPLDTGARRAVLIHEVDGDDPGRSSLRDALKESGFRAGPSGWLKRAGRA